MRCGHTWSKLVGLSLLGMLVAGCSKSSGPSSATVATPASVASMPGCEGAVLPNLQTIESGEYKPLSRPLFVYVNKKALKKPDVAAYVKTMLGAAQAKIEKSGFIKLKAELLKEQQDKLDEAIVGVRIPDKITTGTVSVNGSSTVYPFSAGAAQLFEEANDRKVHVVIGKKGTGGGFEKFCIGETDINNASRPIKKEEIEKCATNKVEYLELTVCMDGISVCVNPKNDWCNCISIAQLKALFEPGSKIKTWKDLDAAWPDKPITLYSPDTDSGTFEYFTEVTVGKAKSSRVDYTQSAEDNVLVRGVAGDTYALGYFGFSYYDKNRKTLKAVGIKPAKKETSEKPAADKVDEAGKK